MAETENRPKQDIGQDEAYVINLKQLVEMAQDNQGRSRLMFDALASNTVATIASINQSIAQTVKQSVTAQGVNDDKMINVNEVDYAARDIINSPWAEAMKAVMTAAVAEALKDKK